MGHVHNALDRATDLIRGYRRALGILGPEGGLERFGETLTPVIDLWGDPRFAVLMGDVPQFGTATVAANAGFRSQIQLRPVPGSNIIVIVHEIIGSQATLIRTDLTGSVGALPTAQANRGNRDSRRPAEARVLMFSDNTAAAVGNARYTQPANVPFRIPIILHEDAAGASSVICDPGIDNAACTISFAWTVHPRFPGEAADR